MYCTIHIIVIIIFLLVCSVWSSKHVTDMYVLYIGSLCLSLSLSRTPEKSPRFGRDCAVKSNPFCRPGGRSVGSVKYTLLNREKLCTIQYTPYLPSCRPVYPPCTAFFLHPPTPLPLFPSPSPAAKIADRTDLLLEPSLRILRVIRPTREENVCM